MNNSTEDIKTLKKNLRREISKRFKTEAKYCLSIKKLFDSKEYSETFMEKIPNLKNYKTAFGYAELPDEFPCYNLLKAFSCTASENHTKKITALPVVEGDYLLFREIDFSQKPKLATGKSFGILEPDESCPIIFSGAELSAEEEKAHIKTLGEISPILIFTPARAFSLDGARLGRGGGFYDKFFAKLLHFQVVNPKIEFVTIGLSFYFQIVDFIPCEKTDFKVNQIITEK